MLYQLVKGLKVCIVSQHTMNESDSEEDPWGEEV